MTELELNKKMYAEVVGEADDIIQLLPDALTKDGCGQKELMEFGEKLKQALLNMEELYTSTEICEEDQPA